VGTILTGLLSFMYDNQPTTGSITTSKSEKQRLARESLATNVKSPTFVKVFPEWVEAHQKRLAEAQAARLAAGPQQGAAAGGEGDAAGKQAAGGDDAEGAAPAPAGRGTSLMTIAAIVVVFAIAVVPLLSATGGKVGLAVVADAMR
jgi:ubiquitin-conjugating enzyme E2 J2